MTRRTETRIGTAIVLGAGIVVGYLIANSGPREAGASNPVTNTVSPQQPDDKGQWSPT